MWRAGLWVKILNSNITGKRLNVIYNLYQKTKSCISSNHEKSELFNCETGVRQGENLSPLLFAIFLNDLENYLSQYSANSGVTVLRHDTITDELTFLKLFILIYADDMVPLTESAQGLQNALGSLYSYCKIWRPEFNTDKTKVMIISDRKFKENAVFSNNNQVLKE